MRRAPRLSRFPQWSEHFDRFAIFIKFYFGSTTRFLNILIFYWYRSKNHKQHTQESGEGNLHSQSVRRKHLRTWYRCHSGKIANRKKRKSWPITAIQHRKMSKIRFILGINQVQNEFTGIGQGITVPQIEMSIIEKSCRMAGYDVDKGKIVAHKMKAHLTSKLAQIIRNQNISKLNTFWCI